MDSEKGSIVLKINVVYTRNINMGLFESPLGNVELTEERLRHIFSFHPEIRSYHKYFLNTLKSPDTIRRSKFEPQVRMLYHKIRKDKYLAVVVKINERNFILTAYTTTKIKHLSL